MTLPYEVEKESFAPQSKSGAQIEEHYLGPLGLARESVFMVDLLPYYLASVKVDKGGSGRSMADNVRLFEESTGQITGIQTRPVDQHLLELVTRMPGNLDRLSDYFGRARPRLLFTIGTEPAAFVRGLSYREAARTVDRLMYGAPERVTVFGVDTSVVHLVHPRLFIDRNPKWMSRHRTWCTDLGHALVAETLRPSSGGA